VFTQDRSACFVESMPTGHWAAQSPAPEEIVCISATRPKRSPTAIPSGTLALKTTSPRPRATGRQGVRCPSESRLSSRQRHRFCAVSK
jgi:hypothetical protein